MTATTMITEAPAGVGLEAWLADRRRGMGGTDAAAILGLSPWRSPMDVWLEKTGRSEKEPPDEDREFLLALGNEMEAGVARLYTRKTGRALEQIPRGTVLRHPKHAVILGTPDRLVVNESRGLEIKTENSFQDAGFGEPGSAEVPDHYKIQVAHYMAITGREQWDFAVLKGGASFSIYTVERDLELEEQMIAILLAWWENHVKADTPPAIDGSDAYKGYLSRKFATNLLPITDADADTERLVLERESNREVISDLEERVATIENNLRAKIGEHDGITGNFGTLTWKRTKDSVVYDREHVISTLTAMLRTVVGRDQAEAQLHMATKGAVMTKPGYRRFHFKPKKESKTK